MSITRYGYTCESGQQPPVATDDASRRQPCNLPRTTTDPAGRVSTIEYTSYGDVGRITEPSGRVTSYSWDAVNGWYTTKTVRNDPAAPDATTTYSWYGNGTLRTQTDPAVTNPVTGVAHQLRTTYSYDGNGNIKTVEQADVGGASQDADATRTTTYEYDARDRQIVQTTVTAQADGAPVSRRTALTYNGLGNLVQRVEANGAVYRFSYDARDRPTETHLINYDSDLTASGSENRDILVARQNYSSAGRLAWADNAMGDRTAYAYTLDGKVKIERLANYVDPDTGVVRSFPLKSYNYDDAGNLLSVTDGSGAKARLTVMAYDERNRRLSTALDPAGLNRRASTEYRSDNLPNLTVTDGVTTQLLYNGAGQQLSDTRVLGPSGEVLSNQVTYNGAGKPAVTTDGDNGQVAIDYDLLDRPIRILQPEVAIDTGLTIMQGRPTVTQGYNTFGELTDERDPNGGVVHHDYDLAGRRVKSTYPTVTSTNGPVTPTEEFGYDAADKVVSVKGKNGGVTKYHHDSLNRILQTDRPIPVAVAAVPRDWSVYDDAGRLLRTTDAEGRQVRSTYDRLGRVVARTQALRQPNGPPLTDTEQLRYDLASNLISITGGSRRITLAYNAAGDLTSSTSADTGTTTYEYDSAGRQTLERNQLGEGSKVQHDFAGRPTVHQRVAPDNTVIAEVRLTLDNRDNTTERRDAEGNVWKASFDAASRLSSLTDPPTTAINGVTQPAATTQFGYDAAGNRTRMTNANGRVTRTLYNLWNLPRLSDAPSTPTYPDTADRRTQLYYDAAGQLIEQRLPGGVVVKSTLDAQGNVRKQAGTGGDAAATRQFEYDLTGLLTAATTPTGQQTFSYDDRRNLVGSQGPSGGYTAHYDQSGRLADETDAAGTRSWTYTDSRSLPGSIVDTLTGLTGTYQRDVIGRPRTVTSTRTSNGDAVATRALTYGVDGNLATDISRDASGAGTAVLRYSWTPNGNLSTYGATGALVAAENHTYTYDAANRLIRDSDGIGRTGSDYAWDAVGNRTGVTDWSGTPSTHTTSSSTAFSYDARNRLTSSNGTTGTVSYTYTPRGTRDTVATTPPGGTAITTDLAFDALDRLIADGTSTYTYDSLDRLATSPTGQHLYAGLGQEPVKQADWQVSRDENGQLLGMRNGGGASGMFITNAHGDAVARIAATNGGVVASQLYGAFGTVTNSAGVLPPFGYQGSWTDAATGLVKAQSRSYDPKTGTFLSEDTQPPAIASAATSNLYTYGNANPTSNSDMNGHFAQAVVIGIYAAIALAAALATPQVRATLDEATLAIIGAASRTSTALANYLKVLTNYGVSIAVDALGRILNAETGLYIGDIGLPTTVSPSRAVPDTRAGNGTTAATAQTKGNSKPPLPQVSNGSTLLPAVRTLIGTWVEGQYIVREFDVLEREQIWETTVWPDGTTSSRLIDTVSRTRQVQERESIIDWTNTQIIPSVIGVTATIPGVPDPVDPPATRRDSNDNAGQPKPAEGGGGGNNKPPRGPSPSCASDKDDDSCLPDDDCGPVGNQGDVVANPESLARSVAEATGGIISPNKGGYTVRIANGSRDLVVRIMNHGGGRTNYYRMSVDGKEAFAIDGTPSSDRGATHIDITGSSREDILNAVSKIKGIC